MMSDEEYMNLYGESWYEIRDRDKRIADLEEKLDWATSQWDRCVKRIAELEDKLADFKTHGRVTKAWGELREENDRLQASVKELGAENAELKDQVSEYAKDEAGFLG